MDKTSEFKLLPRGWVVKHTFGWIMRWRRLVCNYERYIDVSGAIIKVAIGSMLVHRTSHPWPFSDGLLGG